MEGKFLHHLEWKVNKSLFQFEHGLCKMFGTKYFAVGPAENQQTASIWLLLCLHLHFVCAKVSISFE